MFAVLGVGVACILVIWLSWKLTDYVIRIPVSKQADQKYIFVTGCDSGFGKEIVKRLDQKKYYVFGACLTEKGASKLRQETSGRVVTFLLDVTNQESVDKALDFVKTCLPNDKGLWAIINNAGVLGQCSPSEWLSIDNYRSCFDINTWGTIRVCNAFLTLVKKGRGRVVNMSCVEGKFSLPWLAPLSVSSFGIEAYTDSLRREMNDFSVSVHLIEPTFFRTDFCNARSLQENLTKTWNSAPSNKKEEFGEDYFHSAINIIPKIHDKLSSNNIHQVVNAYEHAVTAIFPRTRYIIANNTKYFFYSVIQALPTPLGDFILRLFLRKYFPRPITMQCRWTLLKCLKGILQFIKPSFIFNFTCKLFKKS